MRLSLKIILIITLVASIVAIFLIFFLLNQGKSPVYIASDHVIEANESANKSKQEPSKVSLAFAGDVSERGFNLFP